MFDGESFGLEVVAAVKGFLEQEIAPLRDEIQQLRDQLAERRAPEKGEKGDDGAPGRDGVDGKDGAPGEAGQAGADGRDGIDGKDGEKGSDGADGVGLAGAIIDREGNLVVTLADGRAVALGLVVGANGVDGRNGLDGQAGEKGEPGRDGFSLDDFDIEKTDERTLVLKFQRGDELHSYELQFPCFIDRGVYKDGEEYEMGDGVTWAGSYWLAQEKTSAKPDDSRDGRPWRMAVRKGHDGKNADPAPLLRLIEDKFKDAEDRFIKRLDAIFKAKGL